MMELTKRRLDPFEEERRMSLYRQGLSDYQIAEQTFYSVTAISQWRWSRGLPANHFTKQKLTQEEQEKRLKLYNKGYGDGKIAKECGVSKGAIAQWRWKKGLKSNFKKGQHENK